MDNGYTKRIRERVLSLEDGTVFVTSDFADIADTSTIRQSLSRLVQSGTLRRILKGVYEKAKNTVNFWMNMWRSIRKQWQPHWHEVITGRLPHVGIQH